MALDKQRILNELGSVMNQLQSADCGCMGKLFSSPGQSGVQMGGAQMGSPQMGSPLSTCTGCRHGHCCGHGYGYNMTPSAGEPYSEMSSSPAMNHSCMGRCNPPKLYADTYSYLNKNLMQPVVKEVYNDLKTITPANTVMNNAMGQQMGLASQGNTDMLMAGDNAGMAGQNQMSGQGMMTGVGMRSGGGMMPGENTMMEGGMIGGGGMNNQYNMQNASGNAINPTDQMGNTGRINPMAGMGPQIVNMIMGGSKPDYKAGQVGGPLTGPRVIDAPQSPHGAVGVMPIRANNLSPYNSGNLDTSNVAYGDNTTQCKAQNKMYSNPIQQTDLTGNVNQYNMAQQPMTSMNTNPGMQGNEMANNVTPMNQQMGQMNANPTQQVGNPNRSYGQHSQGMAKFNEMFPRVMQGLGGDLGFDPMAIAIQMNPANQQQAAMDTMNKLMSGKGANRVFDPKSPAMQPVIAGVNAANANLAPNAGNVNQGQNISTGQSLNQQITGQLNATNPNQAQYVNQTEAKTMQPNQGQQQQAYPAVTGAPTINQQSMPNQMQNIQSYQQQKIFDPNTGASVLTSNLPPRYDSTAVDPYLQAQQNIPPDQSSPQSAQNYVKEPIFPADPSRNQGYYQKSYDYNTLGQPVEMLPARLFHPPEPMLSQTLSPQDSPTKLRYDPMKYTNVKSTVSKTSLMGNKPMGKVPSRGQLQHIYNQYKGSQSYTQQNVRPPNQGMSYSEGKLNVANTNALRGAPVEKVGGDTAANNMILNNQSNKVDPAAGQVGDVPVPNKPQGDVATEKTPATLGKGRNGLQDMVYTAYPTSAAWSFHGHNAPYSSGYQFRNR